MTSPAFPATSRPTLFTHGVSTSPTAEGETSEPTAHTSRRARPRRRGRLVALVLLLLVLVAGIMAFLAMPLVHAKQEADAAQSDLKAAKAAVTAQRIDQARTLVQSARAHVDAAHSGANGFGSQVWSVVPVAGGAVHDARHLVDALSESTSVAQLGVELYPMVSGDTSTLMQGQAIDMAVLHQVVQRTAAIGTHLDAAVSDLAQVHASTPVVGGSVARAKDSALGYLLPLQETYQRSGPMIESLPSLVGAKRSRTYLLALLNPAEQRYSGGGALSFSSVTFDHGRVRFGGTVTIEDVVARGATQTWRPVPGNVFHKGGPMKVANATFSPWWSVSSEELLRGYAKAFPGRHYDGVIGIDLQGLAGVFRVTGPVELKHFGTITADNLVSTVAGSYDKFSSTAERKQLNAELVPAFREKFFTGGRMQEKVKSLSSAADARHFFVYFRDHPIQRRFARAGLSGNLSYTDNDYVGVFSQNLNGSKNDYYQHRDVTDTVRLRPDGSALVTVHVRVKNDAPAYTGTLPDPGVGYATRYLDSFLGVFLPNHSRLRSLVVDGKPAHPIVHVPQVPTVHNRKFIEPTFSLNSGESWTTQVSYVVRHAAVPGSGGTLVYRLDADPQPLVTPETLDVTVHWPQGWHPAGALPAGWTATSDGARRQGPLSQQMSAQIPLTRG